MLVSVLAVRGGGCGPLCNLADGNAVTEPYRLFIVVESYFNQPDSSEVAVETGY